MKEWMLDILQLDCLTCPRNRVFYDASVICVSSIDWERAPKGKTDDYSFRRM